MGDTGNPCRKFAVLSVSPLFYCEDCLYKSLLKDIVGDILVFDYSQDIVVDTVLMSFQEGIKSFISS